MQLNLFLLVSIFAALHLSKAGPLRLQKRAAFYIANETACVVDNIVYSNGEPIPTDDPCEACKCRPPGFACVLQECRVKPGCRAVRHVGQCCPEYICGCEHNGRMYQDGEEIPHDKNPCYTCYCQGSSIACAFMDCLFRVDCTPEIVPGECCPRYTNCTRDLPGSNALNENKSQPSLNLLPALNEEAIVPENSATQKPASTAIPTNPPTKSPVNVDRSGEAPVPEVKEPTDAVDKEQTETIVSEESKQDPEVHEKGAGEESAEGEKKPEESPKVDTEDKKTEEENLFNSETEIKKEENSDTPVEESKEIPETVKDAVEDPQTTSANDASVNEAVETVKSPESETASTETPSPEKQVKNSAADNSKSLKLADNESSTAKPTSETLKNESDKGEDVKTEEPKLPEITSEEEVTQSATGSSDKTESADATQSTEGSEENIGAQKDPQSTLYSNSDKIKSESAETVTIVVHIKEKAKPTEERNTTSEQVVPESVTEVEKMNLLQSNNELLSTESSTESEREEKVTLSSTDFEVFPTSTENSKDEKNEEIKTEEPNKLESTTGLPKTEELNKEPESRSEETDQQTSEAELKPESENASDLKTQEESLETTTQNVMSTPEKTPEGDRADVTTEATETSESEPKVTVIKIEEPNREIIIKIVDDPQLDVSKSDQPVKTESENLETTEEPKFEEIKPEIREDDSKPEEKDEISSTENVQKTTAAEKIESTSPQTEKIESTSPQTEKINPEVREAETEEEKHVTENPEISRTKNPLTENESKETTESENQNSEKSTETEAPKKEN